MAKQLRQQMPRQSNGGAGAGVHGALPQRRVQLHLGNSQHGRGINGEARMHNRLKFPSPFFGGKSRIAPLIWERIGDCDNVIEPFCGSAAFLLARPHQPKIETLNDIDCYVANVWRALKYDPEAVAEYADDPVNEADLHARHRWLVGIDPPEHSWWTSTPYLHAMAGASAVRLGREQFRRRMRTDPDYYDARVAGWWLWGACCWIGGGWCSVGGSNGPAGGSGERSLYLGTGGAEGDSPCPGRGVHGAGPALSEGWRVSLGNGNTGSAHGVHADVPDGHRPQLADAYSRGRGVHNDNHLSQPHEKRPILSGGGHETGSRLGMGVHARAGMIDGGTCAQRRAWLLDWFGRLRDRLRTTRVCCGSWERVCNFESVTTRLGVTGLMLDPPYALNLKRLAAWKAFLQGKCPKPSDVREGGNRADGLYATDGQDIDRLVAEVHVYCLERGSHPKMRIALCGYEGEHNELEAAGWDKVRWAAAGGYGNRSARGKANAKKERIWFSPHALKEKEAGLFDGLE